MIFDIIETKREHMEQVVEILKGLSPYAPPKVSYENIWETFEKQHNVYSRVAIHRGSVIGYGAIVIEQKIRGGTVGHIEDIVSHSDFRRKSIGATIIKALCKIADTKGCYKVTLHCKSDQLAFYEKCSFKIGGQGMQKFNTKLTPSIGK